MTVSLPIGPVLRYFKEVTMSCFSSWLRLSLTRLSRNSFYLHTCLFIELVESELDIKVF